MFTNGEPVTWLRAVEGEPDVRGRKVFSYEPVTLDNVGVAPGSTSEPRRGDSNRVTTQMTLYLTTDPGVRPVDRFEVRGVTYEVEGDVSGHWANPFTGNMFGASIGLRRVTG